MRKKIEEGAVNMNAGGGDVKARDGIREVGNPEGGAGGGWPTVEHAEIPGGQVTDMFPKDKKAPVVGRIELPMRKMRIEVPDYSPSAEYEAQMAMRKADVALQRAEGRRLLGAKFGVAIRDGEIVLTRDGVPQLCRIGTGATNPMGPGVCGNRCPLFAVDPLAAELSVFQVQLRCSGDGFRTLDIPNPFLEPEKDDKQGGV